LLLNSRPVKKEEYSKSESGVRGAKDDHLPQQKKMARMANDLTRLNPSSSLSHSFLEDEKDGNESWDRNRRGQGRSFTEKIQTVLSSVLAL